MLNTVSSKVEPCGSPKLLCVVDDDADRRGKSVQYHHSPVVVDSPRVQKMLKNQTDISSSQKSLFVGLQGNWSRSRLVSAVEAVCLLVHETCARVQEI